MTAAARAAALLGALALSSPSGADFVRGTIKVDVRDASGLPTEAEVTVRPQKGGEPQALKRTGEVYVSDGLVDGRWVVEVAGAEPQTVELSGRSVRGAVFVLTGAAKTRGKRSRHATTPFVVSPDEPACDADPGRVVEAVAFAGGRLAAGRLEVRRRGKLVCVAAIAGGGASLRLKPGDYEISARFVGGGAAKAPYHVPEPGKAPPPLMLRAGK